MVGSKDWCGLMFVHSVINCTQIHILKPNGVFSSNYFPYKSKVHNMQLQEMVDHHKCFCNVFVELPKSMNNYKVLWLFNLYQKNNLQWPLWSWTWSTRWNFPLHFGGEGFSSSSNMVHDSPKTKHKCQAYYSRSILQQTSFKGEESNWEYVWDIEEDVQIIFFEKKIAYPFHAWCC
jgi:hypothetical protein